MKIRLEALERQAQLASSQEAASSIIKQVPMTDKLALIATTSEQNSFDPNILTESQGVRDMGHDQTFQDDGVHLDNLPELVLPFDENFMDYNFQLDASTLGFSFEELPASGTLPGSFEDAALPNSNFLDHNVSIFESDRIFDGLSSPTRKDVCALSMLRDEDSTAVQRYHSQRKPTTYGEEKDWGKHIAADLIRTLRLDNNSENQSVLKTVIARGHNVRDVFFAGLSALDKRDAMIKLPLPDPKRNILTFVRTSTLQAYLTVATSLKIPVQELYLEACPSPFYQSQASDSLDLCQAVIASYKNKLSPDLLPTALQITVPHHPWLDLIPFPNFRERVLSLMIMTPPMIDILELKHDIFMNDGIFCWRPSERGGTGHPWEGRNWEAESWFLKKWWMLLGGEGGDIWKHTQWWRLMRGKEKVQMNWDTQ